MRRSGHVDDAVARASVNYTTALLRAIVALSEVDPIGLLAMGCPKDEYMPEAEDIATRMASGEVVDEAVVRDVITHWFGPTDARGGNYSYALIAEKLNR